MGYYADKKKIKSAFGDMADVYSYISYETGGTEKCGQGLAAVTGSKPGLIELELLSNNTPDDERFVPGTKLYVDDDAVMGPDLIPVKNASGESIGYSVLLYDEREASVEEELTMLKRRLTALENA